MSQTLSNVSSSSALGGLWSGSTTKASGTQGTDSAFGLALASMLNGGAISQEGSLAASLTLLAMTGNTSSEGMEDGAGNHGLDALLEGLVKQLEQADETLASDPDLLAMLQSWLQNAMALLNSSSGNASEQTDSDGALQALAEQPHTIRFALQDVMMRLTELNTNGRTDLTLNSQQAGALLGSLQGILATAGLVEEKLSSDRSQRGSTDDIIGKLMNKLENVDVEQQQRQVTETTSQRTSSGNQSSTANDLKLPVTLQQSQEDEIAISKNSAASEVQASEPDGWIQSGSIITAGQLALRDNAAAVMKAPATHVPVEKFGEEVGKFLVNKLEIIKAGGVSEARISLYPEHLGQVDIKITMQNGQMVAQFMTEHLFAKESLEGQMAQLRSALQSQGLQVNKLEVTQNVGLSSHMYQDGRQQGNSSNLNQQNSGRRREHVSDEEILAIHDLNEEWTDWMSEVRAREAGLGSSFVARA